MVLESCSSFVESRVPPQTKSHPQHLALETFKIHWEIAIIKVICLYNKNLENKDQKGQFLLLFLPLSGLLKKKKIQLSKDLVGGEFPGVPVVKILGF